MMNDFTSFPIHGLSIPSLPDVSPVSDVSQFVMERSGTGRVNATALRDYIAAFLSPQFSGTIFATVAALRANTAALSVPCYVEGYAALGDGGQGTFCVLAGDSTTADDGGITFVDALGQRWRRQKGDFGYSVKWWGAKGDGATDDTAAITAAIGALTTAGGMLYFPPGNYHCAPTTFTAVNHAMLYGSAPYAAQVTFTATGTGWTFNNCQDLVLWSLAFVSGASGLSGVNFASGSGVCTVRQCQFTGFDTDGLQFTGTSLAPLSGHKVLDCLFLQNAQKQLHFVWSEDFWISGNQFGITSGSPVPAFGCYLDNSSAGTYTQNYHWNNNVGFSTVNSNFNRIEMNRFEESRAQGVLLQSPGTYNIFSGNTIHTNNESHTGSTAQAAFVGQTQLMVSGNQAFDFTGASQAAFAYSFGAGCANLTVRGNQAGNFATSPYFFDATIVQTPFNADFAFVSTSKDTIAAATTEFIGPGGSASGGGVVTVEVPVGRRCSSVQIIGESNLAPGAGQSFSYTLMVNNVASTLVATTSGALFSSFGTSGVAIAPTDAVCVQVVTSAGAAVTQHRAIVVFADY